MATPNPHFDPDWQASRDYYHDERTCAAAETQRLAEAGEMQSEAYRAAAAIWDRHHAAWCATFKKQYATVEGYAAWVFGTFPPGIRGGSAGVPVPEPDLASFRTVEEVDAAWSRIDRAVNEAAEEKQLSLPVGQPEGMKAFADPASPKLLRYWRHFRSRDLYPAGYRGILGVRTLITADEQEDGWHICFMQDSGPESGSVTNSIEHLATGVYREACAITEERMLPREMRSGWRSLCGMCRKQGAVVDPGRLHFYQHLPPARGCRESFDHVALRFEDGAYRDPRWLGYRVIPDLAQSGRSDSRRGGAPSDIEGYRLAVDWPPRQGAMSTTWCRRSPTSAVSISEFCPATSRAICRSAD